MKRRKFAWLLPLLLAAGAIAAELVCRGLLASRAAAFDAHEARAELLGLLQALEAQGPTPAGGVPAKNQHWRVHPYLGAELRPQALPTAVRAAHAAASGAQEFRVLLLGGAAAEQVGLQAADVLLETLAADPRLADRQLALLCGGARWHKQPQHALRLELLLERGLQFDAVVQLDGFNEVTLALLNHERGIDPLLPWGDPWLAMLANTHLDRSELDSWIQLRAEQSAARRWVDFHASFGLQHSALATIFVRARLLARVARGEELGRELSAERARSPASKALLTRAGSITDNAALRSSVRCWAESALTMQALCEPRGILFLHALEPMNSERANASKSSEMLRKGLLKLQEGGRWLHAQQVAQVDLSALQRIDGAADEQQRQQNTEVLAKALARELLAQLPQQ